MRVVTPQATATRAPRTARAARAANVELVALLACSAVVLLGLCLTTWGRLEQLARTGDQAPRVNLQRLRAPEDLLPALSMFERSAERQAAARALYRRAIAEPRLAHVGGLAGVTLSAAQVRGEPRLVEFRARLRERAGAPAVPVLTPAALAALKPHVVVRSQDDYVRGVVRACAVFIGAFWLAHVVRRWRRRDDDPLVLPALLLLSGIGLMAMLALRDPLRDTLTASAFAGGVAAGVIILLAVSEVDFEASPLRRAVLGPLALALALAAALLVFGSGPGGSGVKVNLLGVQPVEAIRLLVVFALAAFFARRLDLLRELSEPPTPDRPWLRYLRVPRWQDIRPVVVSMALVLLFFFLQKDLGPALVLSCVFLALYGVARGRAAFVLVGVAMMLAGFTLAYWIGFPATVRQRVAIWADPWNNGVGGGNQVAHGLGALATGAVSGSGPGLGSPHTIPAGHTDFVLAVVGEELGFVGLLVVVGLYALLAWRCLRIAVRAPGDYTAILAVGVALALVVQAIVIASGLLGLFPLSGVVTPFLSYGRSSMLANFFGVAVVLAIARRRGAVRAHLKGPIETAGAVLAAITLIIAARAAWIQVVKADEIATAASSSEQADGGYRFEYNPRLVAAARLIERGTIYDRNGLPLAASRPEITRGLPEAYRKAGLALEDDCVDGARCYPLGGLAFSLLGDWNTQVNWGARNSSYIERDSDVVLKGFDDRQRLVDVVHPRTGAQARVARRDYGELLPLARHRYDTSHPAVRALLGRDRDVRTTIDARLQARTAAILRQRVASGGHARGAAVVIDVSTGDVLASVSYPWPVPADGADAERIARERRKDDPLLDRARYGVYPPGSTFKLIVAGAALREARARREETFACERLPGGRVGARIPGWTRPVRDDPKDTSPHGAVDLHKGLVVSCNAYFAQLALRLGPRPILDAASAFQIDAASPPTPASLRQMLPHAGYGQAEVLVTPLKMARVAASIADGGEVNPVRWVRSTAAAGRRVDPDDGAQGGSTPTNVAQSLRPRARLRRTTVALAEVVSPAFLPRSDAALLARYMREVVTAGSGRTLRSHPVAIAGKTGTAEVDGDRAHSWFVGFAPFDGPRRIAFAVIVENAGYGAHTAAPIAGDIVMAARSLGLIEGAAEAQASREANRAGSR